MTSFSNGPLGMMGFLYVSSARCIFSFGFFWPPSLSSYALYQERAAGALANLAADYKCSLEVARAGGVHALVMLARSFMFEGVQEQVYLVIPLRVQKRGKLVLH